MERSNQSNGNRLVEEISISADEYYALLSIYFHVLKDHPKELVDQSVQAYRERFDRREESNRA